MSKSIEDSARDKLRRVKMSSKGTAIFDCLLDIRPRRTSPAIEELKITSDNMLLARHEGDIGFNDFIGPADNLMDNAEGLRNVAQWTLEEYNWIVGKIKEVAGAL